MRASSRRETSGRGAGEVCFLLKKDRNRRRCGDRAINANLVISEYPGRVLPGGAINISSPPSRRLVLFPPCVRPRATGTSSKLRPADRGGGRSIKYVSPDCSFSGILRRRRLILFSLVCARKNGSGDWWRRMSRAGSREMNRGYISSGARRRRLGD